MKASTLFSSYKTLSGSYSYSLHEDTYPLFDPNFCQPYNHLPKQCEALRLRINKGFDFLN